MTHLPVVPVRDSDTGCGKQKDSALPLQHSNSGTSAPVLTRNVQTYVFSHTHMIVLCVISGSRMKVIFTFPLVEEILFCISQEVQLEVFPCWGVRVFKFSLKYYPLVG